MEYILGELGRIKAINEDLKTTIKKQEDDARDNNWLRERNQVLERHLAEKTAEVDPMKAALNTLAQASSYARFSRDGWNEDNSAVAAARRVSE
jgi:phosphoglycerate-specific signal transduction histidine kinase